jgi:hypothetical protein
MKSAFILRRLLLSAVPLASLLGCYAGISGQTCDLNTDCPESQLCSPDGTCAPSLVGGTFFCAPCDDDYDCPAFDSLCVAVGAGSFCATDCTFSDCPDDQVCVEVVDEDGFYLSSQCVPASDQCVASQQEFGGAPVINEIYYNSPGTDTGSFIELKGAPGLSLSGYRLVAYSGTGASNAIIPLSGSISSSGYFVIAQDTTVAGSNAINLGANLVNTSGSLVLELNGAIIDALSYGNPSNILGEGNSAVSAGGGLVQSLRRFPDGQDTNTNNIDFTVGTPTPGLFNGGTQEPPPPPPTGPKKILFDLTKSEDSGNADWRIDGAYSEWANELRGSGYVVEVLTGSAITTASLQGASVLIVPEPQDPFSDNERGVILTFVQNGGGLLLIGDHRISDRNNNGWDSPEAFNGWDGTSPSNPSTTTRKSLDSANLFGLKFSFNSSFSSPVLTATAQRVHPVLNGVTQSGVYVGTSIDITAGISLLGVGGKSYLGANEGRVLAYGDSSAFSDGTFSNGSNDQRNNWGKLDNARLGRNMVGWLAKDQ